MSEFFRRLDQARSELTRSERRVAHAIEGDPSRVAFMTLNQMAKDSGVSEATVLRFARRLGFDSFTELLRVVQNEMQQRHSLDGQLTRSLQRDGPDDPATATYLRDLDNLRLTYEYLDRAEYGTIVDHLVKARRLGVVGFRASAAPAEYFAFMANFARPNVVRLFMGFDTAMDQLIDLTTGDVLVAFSFARPSRRTLDIARLAKDRSVTLVAITDSRVSPLGTIADHVLAAGTKGTFFHSYAAVMSLCTALLSGVGSALEDSARKRITAIEQDNEDEKVLAPPPSSSPAH